MPKTVENFDKICCLNVLALIFCKQNKHEESIKCHQQVLEECSLRDPLIEGILQYNLAIENLHVGDSFTACLHVKIAFDIAERNKCNRNLIFSKILLLHEELCGSTWKIGVKAHTSKNSLKKKTLESMMKSGSRDFRADMQAVVHFESPKDRGRGRVSRDAEDSNQIISLGSKIIKKRRSKTENKTRGQKLVSEKHLFGQRIERNSAAVKIQKMWRRYKLRLDHKINKKLDISARNIQIAYRNYRDKKKFRETIKSIKKIQVNSKRYLARKHFTDKRKKVIKLQAFIRKKIQYQKFNKIRGLAIKIQALIRGFLARSTIKLTHKSAKIIQKQAKVFIANIYSKKNTKLRSFVLRFVINSLLLSLTSIKPPKLENRLLSAIREEKASTISTEANNLLPILKIQSLFRMIPLKTAYKITQLAALILQKNIRAYLSKRKLNLQSQSARKIQYFIQSKIRL